MAEGSPVHEVRVLTVCTVFPHLTVPAQLPADSELNIVLHPVENLEPEPPEVEMPGKSWAQEAAWFVYKSTHV